MLLEMGPQSKEEELKNNLKQTNVFDLQSNLARKMFLCTMVKILQMQIKQLLLVAVNQSTLLYTSTCTVF